MLIDVYACVQNVYTKCVNWRCRPYIYRPIQHLIFRGKHTLMQNYSHYFVDVSFFWIHIVTGKEWILPSPPPLPPPHCPTAPADNCFFQVPSGPGQWTSAVTANTRHSSIVASMLGQRRRRWPNIESTMDQCRSFAGIWMLAFANTGPMLCQ